MQLVFVAGFQLWGESQNEPLDPTIQSASAPAKLREELLEARLREQIQVGVSHGGSFDHRVRESAVAEHVDLTLNNRRTHGVAAHFGQHDEFTNVPNANPEVQESVIGGQTDKNSLHHESLGVAAHSGQDDTDAHADEEVNGMGSSFVETKPMGGPCTPTEGSDDDVAGECKPDCNDGLINDEATCSANQICCVSYPGTKSDALTGKIRAIRNFKKKANDEWEAYENARNNGTDPGPSCVDAANAGGTKNSITKCNALSLMYELKKGKVGDSQRTKHKSFSEWIDYMNKAKELFFGTKSGLIRTSGGDYWEALKTELSFNKDMAGNEFTESVKYTWIRKILKSIIKRIFLGRDYRKRMIPSGNDLQEVQDAYGLWTMAKGAKMSDAQAEQNFFAIPVLATKLRENFTEHVQKIREGTAITVETVETKWSGKGTGFARAWKWIFGTSSTKFEGKFGWIKRNFKDTMKKTRTWELLEEERTAIMLYLEKLNFVDKMAPIAEAIEQSLEIEKLDNNYRTLFLQAEGWFSGMGKTFSKRDKYKPKPT